VFRKDLRRLYKLKQLNWERVNTLPVYSTKQKKTKQHKQRNNNMSKVKKEVIEAAALKLLSDITMTMPTPTYKFLLGSISAVATMNNGQKIHEILGIVADNEGYVDLDMLKTIINGGFDASGGKISMDLFKNQGGLLSMFVKPITLTITKDDI
jgi:hypothetical protein